MKSCRERDPGSSAYENNKRDKDERGRHRLGPAGIMISNEGVIGVIFIWPFLSSLWSGSYSRYNAGYTGYDNYGGYNGYGGYSAAAPVGSSSRWIEPGSSRSRHGPDGRRARAFRQRCVGACLLSEISKSARRLFESLVERGRLGQNRRALCCGQGWNADHLTKKGIVDRS